jgi:hypothetical protein
MSEDKLNLRLVVARVHVRAIYTWGRHVLLNRGRRGGKRASERARGGRMGARSKDGGGGGLKRGGGIKGMTWGNLGIKGEGCVF